MLRSECGGCVYVCTCMCGVYGGRVTCVSETSVYVCVIVGGWGVGGVVCLWVRGQISFTNICTLHTYLSHVNNLLYCYT